MRFDGRERCEKGARERRARGTRRRNLATTTSGWGTNAFTCSYGYIASLRGCYIDVERNEVPQGFIASAVENFERELREIGWRIFARETRMRIGYGSPTELREKVLALCLGRRRDLGTRTRERGDSPRRGS